jgi:hypothetical protein
MIHIPTHLPAFEERTGGVPKRVTCEACAREYSYLLRRTRSTFWVISLFHNNDDALRKARAKADKKVAQALQNGCDDAPCPHCGWIQDSGSAVARRKHAARPFFVSLALVLGSAILLEAFAASFASSPQPVDRNVAIVCFTAVTVLFASGLFLMLVAANRMLFFDPNSLPLEERLCRAARETALLEHYLEQQKVPRK